MSVFFINGIPVTNARRMGYIDSYFTPQSPCYRDEQEIQDAEYEEIYEQPNEQENEDNQTMVE